MTHFNRDRFSNVPPKKVAGSTMAALDGLQRFEPETQIMGVCALFLLMCEEMDQDPQDIFTATRNLLVASEEDRAEFRGARQYIRGELYG